MKKLITILATVVLITGSVASATNTMHCNVQTTKVFSQKTNPTQSNYQATNEDVEQIAGKLVNKKIKIDPNYWLGKDIKNYQTQLNAAIVKDGILTQDEVQYVSWSDYTVSQAIMAKTPAHFTVKKDGATAYGIASLNASIGESATQVAAKLSKVTPVLNIADWKSRKATSYIPQLRSLLVNEKILTKPEASLVTNVKNTAYVFPTTAAIISLSFEINDGSTTAYSNGKVNLKNDGNNAATIAANIQNKFYGLKQNTVGMYADSSYVTNDFRSLLVNSYDQGSDDMNHVTLPHVKLQQDNKNIKAQVMKDGEIVTANIELVDYTSNYLFYESSSDTTLTYYLNLNPTVVNVLKKFFPTAGSKDDLGYFLNVLDDGNANDYLPHYNGTSYFPWWQRLAAEFKEVWDIDGNECCGYLDNLNGSGAAFESELYKQVMNSNGYVSIMMNVEYVNDYDVETTSYAFW